MRKNIYYFLLLAFIGISQSLIAQKLPSSMQWSNDGKMLITGKSNTSSFYDSSIIRDVHLSFAQANYWTLLQQNYNSKTDLPATMIVDSVTYDSVGVRFKGNTSYKNVANSQKKSFNISLNYAKEDQEIEKYSTLNFNNAYEDKSFLREVFYLHQIRKHVPAAKGNFIHLYINNQDWGVYPNIQQLNKDFIKEWFFSNNGINWRADSPNGTSTPGWGDGTAALNYISSDTTQYKNYYTLKSSDLTNPWDSLKMVCNVLNNSGANLETVLPNHLDIDRTLWFLASEIAFSDDDSYVMKGKMDYYAYFDPETNRLTPLEFDGNSVMGSSAVSWSAFYNATKINYPLLYRMLQVPAWRQRYLAHLRTIISENLDATSTQQILDNYKTQIDALVQSDPKKIYTYTQFVSEVTVLKNWINSRRNNLLANAEVAQIAPSILYVKSINNNNEEWVAPKSYESELVLCKTTHSVGIAKVSLYYSNELTGNFEKTEMFDDGSHNDSLAGDGIYAGIIPGYVAGTYVRYYVESVASNASASVSYLPVGAEHDVYAYQVQTNASAVSGLVINEIMASNTTTVTDNFGEYDDWIELYNNTNDTINLGDLYLTDNPSNLDKWSLPDTTLLPNAYYIIWADEDSSQGVNHCNFKLSASGEILMILDAQLNLVDSLNFGTQEVDKSYARIPNGTGPFTITSPSFNSINQTVIQSAATIEKQLVKIYPNPANTKLIVETTQMSSLKIYNLLGELVYNTTIKDTEHIDTSSWVEGIYIVNIENTFQKIIITH